MKAFAAGVMLISGTGLVAVVSQRSQPTEFTQAFPLAQCTFSVTGRTSHFILEPGHTLVLEDKKGVHLAITVLNETENVGGVTTRVVEERQTEQGALVEVSRNYFAICGENKSVFYFGEAVDNYKDGKIVNHDGSWRHGINGATAGLMMPALPSLGSRYYQEVAPKVAMDRAEITATDTRLKTPHSTLTHVLETRESTPMEPGVSELKAYAPGIGLVRDADLLLVSVKTATGR